MHAIPQKVISVGANRELLLLRDAVLKSAGFDVFTTENEAEALIRIKRGDCGVLLVCHSLPLETQQHLAAAYRKYCPHARIVAITNKHVETLDNADGFVYGIEGPEILIDALRGNIQRSFESDAYASDAD